MNQQITREQMVQWERKQHPWADDMTAERIVNDELRSDPRHYEKMLSDSDEDDEYGDEHDEPDGDEAPDITVVLGGPKPPKDGDVIDDPFPPRKRM